MLKVSIITPSYNQGRFIEETILSVKNQDYPNIEHIIIDGGSTDGTIEILKRYDHLIWVSEPDNGQTNAINKGFRMATGDILTYLNSDDLLLPGAVRAVVDAFNIYPEVDFVYGNYTIIDSKGNHLLSRKTINYDRNVLIYGRALIAQPASFFRRDVIEKIGLLDESYDFCMDLEFWIRAALNGIRFQRLDFPLAAQRLHNDAKTMNMGWKLNDEHRRILNQYGLLWFKNFETFNKIFFLFLKFFFRVKASAKRAWQHGDFRIFVSNRAKKRAGRKNV